MAQVVSFDQSSVVVPAVDNPSTVACIRSLGSAGVHTIVASDHRSTPALRSTFCDEFVRVPSPAENLLAYKEGLLDLASRADVRTIVPVRKEDSYLFARYSDEFDEHVSLVAPSMATLRRVHDRVRLVNAATSAGVPVPETQLLEEVEDWSPNLIVKSRYNLLASAYVDSLGPETVLSADTIEHLTPGEEPDIAALEAEMHHEPIVQEYVAPEAEYMVGALYDHGEPLATVQHRQIRGTKYTGSGGVYRESVAIPELRTVAHTLLDHLDWHGLACLEYVKDASTGEFKLVEINPRMWQSLAANVRMGADFPRYYWKQALERTAEIDSGYDVGVSSHWLKGELLYASSLFRCDSPLVDRPGSLSCFVDIVSSCLKHPHFEHLTRDDPGPFFQEWWALLGSLLAISRARLSDGRPATTNRPGGIDHPERETVRPHSGIQKRSDERHR